MKLVKELIEDRKRLRNAYHSITEPQEFNEEYINVITDSRIKLYRELERPYRCFAFGCLFYFVICLFVTFVHRSR